MDKKIFLFSLLFLSGSFLGVNAQIVDSYLKSKARVATSRIGQNADKEVDSQINKGGDK